LTKLVGAFTPPSAKKEQGGCPGFLIWNPEESEEEENSEPAPAGNKKGLIVLELVREDRREERKGFRCQNQQIVGKKVGKEREKEEISSFAYEKQVRSETGGDAGRDA